MNDQEPSIPATTSPDEVLKWMLFYLGGFTRTVQDMTTVLATEAHVESHPKALVTLQRRVVDMQRLNAQVTDYLKKRSESDPS